MRAERRSARIGVEIDLGADIAFAQRPAFDLDVRFQCLGKLFAVRQVGRDHPHIVDHDVDLRCFAVVAVMDLAAFDGEAVDLHREKLLHLLRPRFIHPDLRVWSVHEIHLCLIDVDLADECAVKERLPFD